MLNDIKDILGELKQELVDKRYELELKGVRSTVAGVLSHKIQHLDACIKHLESMSCEHNYLPIGEVLSKQESIGVALTQRLYCTKCAKTKDIRLN